jgi:hypothetical protein
MLQYLNDKELNLIVEEYEKASELRDKLERFAPHSNYPVISDPVQRQQMWQEVRSSMRKVYKLQQKVEQRYLNALDRKKRMNFVDKLLKRKLVVIATLVCWWAHTDVELDAPYRS